MKLVLHHRYRDGLAFDVTGSFNHGSSNNVRLAQAPYEGILFDGPQSRVHVRPSRSLMSLRTLNAVVSVHIPNAPTQTSKEQPQHFHPLVFIDGLGGIDVNAATGAVTAYLVSGHTKLPSLSPYEKIALLGTVKNPAGYIQNTGPDPHWHELELRNDGAGFGELLLDGVSLAQTYEAPAAESVGQAGITIGGVPDPATWPYTQWPFGQANINFQSFVYGFGGYVRETKIYKQDLQAILDCLRNMRRPTGDDRVVVADFLNTLLTDATPESIDTTIRKPLNDLLDLLGDVGRDLTANGPQNAQPLRTWAEEVWTGIIAGDNNRYRQGIVQSVPLINQVQTPTQKQACTQRLEEIRSRLPKQLQSLQDVQALAHALGAKIGG